MGFSGFGETFGCGATPVPPGGGPIELSALRPRHGAPVVAEAVELFGDADVRPEGFQGVGPAVLVGTPVIRETLAPRLVGPLGGCQSDRTDWGFIFRT
jgi:hypothetical protein